MASPLAERSVALQATPKRKICLSPDEERVTHWNLEKEGYLAEKPTLRRKENHKPSTEAQQKQDKHEIYTKLLDDEIAHCKRNIERFKQAIENTNKYAKLKKIQSDEVSHLYSRLFSLD